MRAFGLALVTAVAIGCSSGVTPTSPSTSYNPVVAGVQDVKPTHTPGTQTATIYFNARELELVGHEHLVGLPVYLDGFVSKNDTTQLTCYNRTTGKQGTVSADFPKSDTWIHVRTPAWQEPDTDREGQCWAATDTWVPLPYVPRENWVNIFISTTACPAPILPPCPVQ